MAGTGATEGMSGMVVYSKDKPVPWQTVVPALGQELTDARLQLHHAAQFVAAVGISFLRKQDDDSHTNMQWLAGTLASNPVGPNPFRLGIRPHPLELVLLAANAELASYALNGRTIGDATKWIRARVTELGLDGERYTLAKHYTIPPHRVERGLPFDDTDGEKFAELARWYSNASIVLEAIARSRADASPVRCWPHHFDIATLITLGTDRWIGLGMDPGDESCEEPYWYTNTYPPLTTLPASRMVSGDGQREQAEAFLRHCLV
jgi:hypothetical protein